MHVRHLSYLCYGDLNVVCNPFCMQQESPKKSHNHGRQTSSRPGHHRAFICFQAGSGAPKPGRSTAASRYPENLRSKRNLPLEMFALRCPLFFKSWLPSLSLHSGRDFSVVLPGWVERRVHILFIWLDHFTSASPFPPLHTLYSRFSFAPPCWTETKPTASSSLQHISATSAA